MSHLHQLCSKGGKTRFILQPIESAYRVRVIGNQEEKGEKEKEEEKKEEEEEEGEEKGRMKMERRK